MRGQGFTFGSGNLSKLINLPRYALSLALSWVVPRDPHTWVFGSGIGVGEGALPLYREVQRQDPTAKLLWLVGNNEEILQAERAQVAWEHRSSSRGYWATLRAGTIVVTHGFGDVNRFGIFGGFVVQLWHGAPLKRLHLDSQVTTSVRGPLAPLRGLLTRMYRVASGQISLFVAGSETAAVRIRSAFRLPAERVAVLGDPRDDALARLTHASERLMGERVRALAGIAAEDSARLVLYAPTWRDGAPDPAVPTHEEWAAIDRWARAHGSRLVIRSHPLGEGNYRSAPGTRIHLLGADTLADITPVLGAFDTVITDYSSLALDFSLLGRSIVWFSPDLAEYEASRGLYEPYRETTAGQHVATWAEVIEQLELRQPGSPERAAAKGHTVGLRERYHAFPAGGATQRVFSAIQERRTQAGRGGRTAGAAPTPAHAPTGGPGTENAVFFESFYGRAVACNPRAMDREIAHRFPEIIRYWSVADPAHEVPPGAHPVVVDSPEWHRARRASSVLIVNDWLRLGFRANSRQRVLQTWHGTMLKRLALERPGVGLRTQLAIRRESRRWDLLLSQNEHSTQHFRSSYAYRGPIWQAGYPRNDSLAWGDRNQARQELGIDPQARVLLYAPTWRDGGTAPVDAVGVGQLATQLGSDWLVLVRGHTRTHEFGGYPEGSGVRDVSHVDDVAPLLLAADVLVTDYSSIMFDASVAGTPMAFLAPDLAEYRDAERGFTFDFEGTAPGPILRTREQLVVLLRDTPGWEESYRERYQAWRRRFTPHDDGHAAERIVARLSEAGWFDSPARKRR